MASQPYRLVVLGADRDWVEQVVERCRRSVAEIVEGSDVLAIEDQVAAPADPAEAPPHSVVLFLADEDSHDDDGLIAQLEDAREQLIPVLPVVRSEAEAVHLPELLRTVHAVPWERDGASVAGDALRLLGLADSERRLFLSYRRAEASSLALQLREHLSRRSFDVFLDRFSVPPAADFQRRIDIELADKAFVLLLESPAAVGSQWVQHEVAYALSHGISLLALCLPETTAVDQFPSVDEAFRMRLREDQLRPTDDPAGPDDRWLTDGALDAVLDAVESRYARQLRRRRTALIGSLEHWLHEAGRDPRPTRDEWALAARDPGEVFLVSPRAPRPADLRRLDGLRRAHPAQDGAPVRGHLLFGAPVQDPEDARLIAWIVGRRPLATRPHVTTPELLGLS